MGIIHLSMELAFDFIAFLMGGILILQAKDNYLKLYWDIIASCIGILSFATSIIQPHLSQKTVNINPG